VHPRHLYFHVPFCSRRCAYCDFSIAVRANVPVDAYIDGVDRELALRFDAASDSDRRWTLDTLYFGGGTPSRLGGAGVAKLVGTVRSRLDLAPGAEVTLEANPEDVTAEAAAMWRGAGVNRLSIGAQSFDDAVLRWMHRTHDAAAIPRAVEHARRAGFDDYSLDLIFALPSVVERDWERDVASALSLEPAHLSLYGLTVEAHTPLGRWRARGELAEAPDERYEREFLYAHAALTSAGLEHYEVSNFGRPARHSRHNGAYWSGVSYGGLGPSAHGFDGNARRWNVGPYVEWLRRVAAGEDPVEGSEWLDAGNRAAETVYLGLRRAGGLCLESDEVEHVAPWISAGWATLGDDNRLGLTALGWLRLDALAADLTTVRSH
jgi:putative oxygen-independent coproporphyrinogen III oxidase